MTTQLLQALAQAGALRTLDHAFAQSLRRLDPATPDSVLAAAALASLAVASGHAGFDPAQPRRLVEADIDWPEPEAWRAELAASRWVARPATAEEESAPDAPLVLEAAPNAPGLLYLRRYREYERRLAYGLRRIGTHAPDPGDPAALAALFARLFPGAAPAGPADASPPAHTDGIDASRPDAAAHPGPPPASPEEPPSRTGPGVPAKATEQGAPAPPDGDHQAQAAALALHHTLLLITGGPGTGKTTTITRLLVLLAAQAQHAGRPAPRIALAAPTGRAAERMAESVRAAVQALAEAGIDPTLCQQLPTTGTTLHRLLGTIPDSPSFRHHADNPLPFDVVVVDEASMIDLPLMAKLVEAVPPGARLVLLGDPDQLPSVEAGDVLTGILVGAAHGRETHTPTGAHTPAPAGDPNHAQPAGEPTPFPGRRVHLTRGYRQSESLNLAPLATAVRQGDTNTTLSLLRGATLTGVHFHENLTDPLQAHRDRLLAHWAALAEAPSPAEALAQAARLRILTAVREGPQGARGLNARIEGLLAEAGLAGPQRRAAGPGHFHGRLLLITENSYRHRLFNGDIGICLRDATGALAAWFPGDDTASPRPFHPAALPAHESAFAMTVHKAQGSEFDEVWLLLPARFNRVLSRELIYTGLTRARHALHLAGSAEVIVEALARHAGRWSGLGWRLGGNAVG
ncbi:exodeoxyribonuclease V subunit alpha [Luteimonas suaedae]|uniref:exodeoxyribonuclease V subunit alpha n=1 Tax=Luteimonas suaedae TaxID=2605430 RepID=UPI0011EE8D37|nr:exodeoxyribonuclease V subunit alpha [Luteimonas suaedae]